MLCEKCGQNPATTHIQKTMGGISEELHLCAECAKQAGYGQLTFDIGDLWPSLFGGMIKEKASVGGEERCEGCGSSYADFLRDKRVGCAQCYDTFKNQLTPSLERVHGKAKHTGKIPRTASNKAKMLSRLESLKQELAKAVEEQNYERAAELRDEIKDLEGPVKGNE